MSYDLSTRPQRLRRPVETPRGAFVFMLATAALLWALEIVDTIMLNFLDRFGIHAHSPEGLIGILFAPFLHFGFEHLLANTGPLVVLGFLILVGVGGLVRFVVSTVSSALTSGLAAWLLSPPYAVIAGASGVVFGWLTYLLAKGFFARDWKSVLVALVVFLAYGSVLWGVLPTQAGVSWQGHLGGAVGGIIAASLLHRRRTTAIGR